MFDSGINALDFVTEIKGEVDIEIEIPIVTYMRWINAVEQLLYGEIIREQRATVIDANSLISQDGKLTKIQLSQLAVEEKEANARFEDIHAVYADDTQLIKSTATSGVIFPNAYYKVGNDLGLNLKEDVQKIKIVYFVRPNPEQILDRNIMLPIEFMDMVGAKLRGEAYKLANEDSLAAKWLNDYNVSLENFKMWISGKQSEFGI